MLILKGMMSNHSFKINSEQGYTLTEILVALTVLTVVIGLTSSLYLFAQSQLNHWRTNTRIESKLHILNERISNDLISADRIMMATDSLVHIIKDDTNIRYRQQRTMLYKNITPVFIEDGFEVFLSIGEKGLELNGEKVSIQYQLKVTYQGESRIVSNQVMCRNPVAWVNENNDF